MNEDYNGGDDPHWENRKRKGLLPQEQDNEKTGFRWWVIALFIVMLTVVVLIVKPAKAGEFGEFVIGEQIFLPDPLTCSSFVVARAVAQLMEVDQQAGKAAFEAFVRIRWCSIKPVVLVPIEVVGAYTDTDGDPWLVVRSETDDFRNLPIIFWVTLRVIVFEQPTPTSFGEQDA